MADRLYIPAGARDTSSKRVDGLHIGAVVVLENTGYGEVDTEGKEFPINGLVLYVYPDATLTTDRTGAQVPWQGMRPFIDVAAVFAPGAPQDDGRIIMVQKCPWAEDVKRINQILTPQDAAQHQTSSPFRPGPQYRVVTSLQGIL